MAKKIYRNVNKPNFQLPKAKQELYKDDIISISVKKTETKNGFKINLPVGFTVRVKPSTLQNAKIALIDGKKIQLIIVNCYDVEGRYIYWIPYECITNDTLANKMLNDFKVK